MTRNVDALSARRFDVIVIGGGITGACIAHDAALRGLAVALLEKGDFGAATSAASSKLLHGGIRYLQQAQFDKVRESARERTAFLSIAPHLVHWMPFLIPTTRSLTKGRVLLGAGIAGYHLVSAGVARRLPRALRAPADGFLSRRELAQRHPMLASLDGVTGAWVIHEAHMHSSERMTLAFVKTAVRHGAVAANYAEVVRLLLTGDRVTGVEVLDRCGAQALRVEGMVVVNAAGPWIGGLNARLAGVHLRRDITAFSKGVHLVTRPLLEEVAVALPTAHRSQAMIQRGGRHLFIIPWQGRSLIGTTNVPFAGTPDEVAVTTQDVDTFIAEINEALPEARLAPSDVQHAFAGLYPLTEEVVRPELYQGTGLYQLVDHADHDGLQGFVSALGAKYTTARRLAERTVDVVMQKLRRPVARSTTGEVPLLGGDLHDVETYRLGATKRFARLPADVVTHLVTHYGTEIDAIVDLGSGMSGGLEPVAAGRLTVAAEIRFAVADEMAVRLEDVIFRRTGLGSVGHPGRTCLERCADIQATALGWDEARRRDEIAAVDRRFVWSPVATT
jgi:glycerol-3-phosphate dehydrogenase